MKRADKEPMFAPDPCRCECGCRERMTPDETRFFDGLCIACGGGFHGLQAALRNRADTEGEREGEQP